MSEEKITTLEITNESSDSGSSGSDTKSNLPLVKRLGCTSDGIPCPYGPDNSTYNNTTADADIGYFSMNFTNQQMGLYAMNTASADDQDVSYGTDPDPVGSLPNFLDRVYNPGFWTTIFNDWGTDLTSAILFIRAYPFSFYSNDNLVSDVIAGDGESGNRGITIMGRDINDTYNYFVGKEIKESTRPLDFGTIEVPYYFNDFRDYAPYTTFTLYLPFYGQVTLDNNIVLGKTIHIIYMNDLYTGKTTIYVDLVEDSEIDTGGNSQIATNRTIWTGDCQMYIDITTYGKDGTAKNIASLDATLNGLGTVATAGMLGMGSSVGAFSGGMTALSGMFMAQNAMNPNGGLLGNIKEAQKNNMTGSNPPKGSASWNGPTECYLYIERKEAVNINNVAEIIGRPSGETKNLSDLEGKGYTTMSVINLKNIKTSNDYYANSTEVNELKRLLESGVFL